MHEWMKSLRAICAFKQGTLPRTIASAAPQCFLQRHTVSHTLTHTHTVLNRCAPLADLPPYPDMHMEPPSTHSQLSQLHKAQRSMRSLLSLTDTHSHKQHLGHLNAPMLHNAPSADYQGLLQTSQSIITRAEERQDGSSLKRSLLPLCGIMDEAFLQRQGHECLNFLKEERKL